MDFFFYRSHDKIRWFKYTALPSSLPGSDLTSSGKSRREGRVFLMFILFYQGSFYITGKVVNHAPLFQHDRALSSQHNNHSFCSITTVLQPCKRDMLTLI